MNWVDIRNTVESVAGTVLPGIGGLIAGPAGAKVGGILASVLGVANTPDAVQQALQTDPQAAVKLAQIASDERIALALQATQERQAQITADTTVIESINKTMQGESNAEHFLTYAWRPIWGLVSAAAFFVVCVLCCILAYQAVLGGHPEAMSMTPQLVGSFTALFGIPGAILGIASWHRGVMQVQQVKSTVK